jgi:hypothetical protein
MNMCIFFCRWQFLKAAKDVGCVGFELDKSTNVLGNLMLDGNRFATRKKKKKKKV